MKPELALAAQVGAQASLADVRQIFVSAELHQLGATSLHATAEFQHDWNRTDSILVCQVACTLEITDGEGGEAVMSAAVTYAGAFTLPDDFDASDEAFEAFTKVSASFSLHPYIREALQSLTSKAGLPAFVLTPIRLPVDNGQAEAAIRRSEVAVARKKAPARRKPAATPTS